MATVDLGNAISVTYTTAAAAVAPATAYANWAAALGVSPTASLYAMDGDDASYVVQLAAAGMINSAVTSAVVSSEGGFGLYRRAPINQSNNSITTIPNVSRMSLPTDRPEALFTFHPPVDAKTVGVKLQRAGTSTIIGGRIQQYQSTTTPINVADFAIRMDDTTMTMIVAVPSGDTSVPLYVMDGTVNLAGALMDTVVGGTQREISATVTNTLFTISSPIRLEDMRTAGSLAWTGTPVYVRHIGDGRVGRKNYALGDRGLSNGRVRGTTKDKGSPNIPVSERTVLFRQRDALAVRQVWSTAGTGAYSFDYVDETETYFVVSFDHDGTFRAVIADGLTLAGGGVELIA